jgi:hypothetical protein
VDGCGHERGEEFLGQAGALQQRLADRMGQVPSTPVFRHVCPGLQVQQSSDFGCAGQE